MAIIGYMRVSTHHQKFDSQLSALTKYGVDYIYKEYESGCKNSRIQLKKALTSLNPGDTFVVFKLDRLARDTKKLLQLMETFDQEQIKFVSIQNNIDTSTPIGKFFFTIMGAFAEMEANLIRERVLSGLDAARENGTTLGRPVLTKKIETALNLYVESNEPVRKIATKCNLSASTVYNHIRKQHITRNKNIG